MVRFLFITNILWMWSNYFGIFITLIIIFPIEVGWGDVTYNYRRSILGAIPVGGRTAYHLFTIDTSTSNAGDIVKLNRKSKWHSQHSTDPSNRSLFIASHLLIMLFIFTSKLVFRELYCWFWFRSSWRLYSNYRLLWSVVNIRCEHQQSRPPSSTRK